MLIVLLISAVDVVMSKTPITMLDTVIDVKPYLPLLSKDEHLESLEIHGLPGKLTEDLLSAQVQSILSAESQGSHYENLLMQYTLKIYIFSITTQWEHFLSQHTLFRSVVVSSFISDHFASDRLALLLPNYMYV